MIRRKLPPPITTAGTAPVLGDTRFKSARTETMESMDSNGSASEWHDPSQSLIIFDWDDTLCPSHWIRQNRPELSYFRPPPNEDRFVKPLAELQELVYELLELSMKSAKVIIVTNAKEPWVNTSCANFMPKLSRLLRKIPVIYAQSIWAAWGLDTPKGFQKGSSTRKSNLFPAMRMSPHPLARPRLGTLGVTGLGLAQQTIGNSSYYSSAKGSLYGTPTTAGTGSMSDLSQSSRSSIGSYERNDGKSSSLPGSPNGSYCPSTGTPLNMQAKMAELNRKLFDTRNRDSMSTSDMCFKWKELTFGMQISDFYSRYQNQSWKNVISIGDAIYEKTAAKHVFETCSPAHKKKKRLKTVKMLDEPSIQELILQIRKIIQVLPIIINRDGNLDVELDEKDLEFGKN